MKGLLIALFALPLAVSATPIYVEYEGVVSSSNDADYVVGDSFSGTLTIDSALAPPDLEPENPNWGLYGSPDLELPGPNFITGFQDMPGARASHLININRGILGEPDFPRGYDQLDINDMQGNGTADRSWLELAVQLPGLLPNDGLVQSFEVSSPEGIKGLFAKLEEGWDAATTTVRFALSRFSITPTPGVFSCRR